MLAAFELFDALVASCGKPIEADSAVILHIKKLVDLNILTQDFGLGQTSEFGHDTFVAFKRGVSRWRWIQIRKNRKADIEKHLQTARRHQRAAGAGAELDLMIKQIDLQAKQIALERLKSTVRTKKLSKKWPSGKPL